MFDANNMRDPEYVRIFSLNFAKSLDTAFETHRRFRVVRLFLDRSLVDFDILPSLPLDQELLDRVKKLNQSAETREGSSSFSCGQPNFPIKQLESTSKPTPASSSRKTNGELPISRNTKLSNSYRSQNCSALQLFAQLQHQFIHFSNSRLYLLPWTSKIDVKVALHHVVLSQSLCLVNGLTEQKQPAHLVNVQNRTIVPFSTAPPSSNPSHRGSGAISRRIYSPQMLVRVDGDRRRIPYLNNTSAKNPARGSSQPLWRYEYWPSCNATTNSTWSVNVGSFDDGYFEAPYSLALAKHPSQFQIPALVVLFAVVLVVLCCCCGRLYRDRYRIRSLRSILAQLGYIGYESVASNVEQADSQTSQTSRQTLETIEMGDRS
eukprot:TRINITY_DN1642_c0_g1_i1.p1 TRINITY_DN1642_c0_g1~~TRINITY_DN1642_c0_g1_i1.p1  ORF type:complete len:376 (-),score=-2.29 TRINITY_DN1642_c0_g1_i1:87-1214(-)